MDTEGWAWVIVKGDDSDYWEEEARIDRWMDAGSPPVEEWEDTGQPTPSVEMPQQPKPVTVPSVALAVTRKQAADLLSMSPDHFERHVLPELRVMQVSRKQLIPVVALQDYVNQKSARALKD